VANTSALSAPVDGKRVMKLTPWTSFSHEPQTLLVLGSAYIEGQQWLRVLLPVRPDGSTAWVTTNQVVLSHTDYWITVRQSARRVLVYRQGVLRRSFLAVIGKPSTPTPTGLGAIYEEDPEPSPNDFLGTWALPLTLLSHALTSFDGGPGRVAIHGRGGTSLLDPLGQALSHGCIRIDNGNVGWIATHVPIGTPVDITP
jgi:lipoprotein-anchoring transpeptidase ErfK/SrfK